MQQKNMQFRCIIRQTVQIQSTNRAHTEKAIKLIHLLYPSRINRGVHADVIKIVCYYETIGKENENSYQKLKRSLKNRHMETVSRYFDRHGRQ